MSERTGVELSPPQYLDQVEHAIGLRFFPDEASSAIARTSPSDLGAERLATYTEIYVSGLRLLAAARHQFTLPHSTPIELTPIQIKLLRRRNSSVVDNLRDRLSTVSPVVPEGAFKDTVTQAALQAELNIGQSIIESMMCDNGLLYLTFRRSRKSRMGMLQHSAVDAERIRELAAAIVVADENDVQFTPLVRELGSTPPRIRAVMEALGIAAVEKRIVEQGRLASYFTPEDADLLRAYFASKEDHAGFLTIAQIATAAEVSTSVVRKQIAWRQFDQHIQSLRQRLSEDGKLSTAFYLPEEYANQIIAELQVIVPDEYLTIGEYSELRGLNHSNVRHAITRLGLATHDYTQREKTIAYLDGATMHQLDQVLEAAQVAPVGWRTMKEIEALVDATDITIAKELKGDFAEGAVRRLKPRDSDGGAIPHYSPEFVAHVQSVIKPKDAPKNHTSLQDLVAQTGMTSTGLILALRRTGIPAVQTRSAANGNVVNYYPNDLLTSFLAELPPRIIPEGGVSLADVALAMGCSVEAARQRLRTRGIKSRRYWSVTTNGMSGYYIREELIAAGITLPETPSPVDDLPLSSTPRHHTYDDPWHAKQAETTTASFVPSRAERYQPAKSLLKPPSHHDDQPGAWQPTGSLPMDDHLSITERLSVEEIAERLGTSVDIVHQAITRIDPGEEKPVKFGRQAKLLYRGNLLLSIREQIIGIPLGYAQVAYGISDEQLDRARRFLQRRGYHIFPGDRCSPGAFKLLSENINAL